MSRQMLALFGSVLVCSLVASTPAYADLLNLGNGMVDGTVQGLTWLRDVTYARADGISEPVSLILLSLGMFGAASLGRRRVQT